MCRASPRQPAVRVSLAYVLTKLGKANEALAMLDGVLAKHGPSGLETSRRVDGYDEAYFIRLALLHEYMHAEAITYTRQTLDYSPPKVTVAQGRSASAQVVVMSNGGFSRHVN